MKVVALVGCPNVGKSTLFNRLTKTRDALVADFPGLTRDRKYGRALCHGREYIVIDTGGITEAAQGEAEDPKAGQLRALMTSQALRAIDDCDLALFMVDARAGLLPGDYTVADYIRRSGKRCAVLANKVDGLDPESAGAEFYALGLGEVLPMAVVHGRGMGILLDDIIAPLLEEEPEPQEDTAAVATGTAAGAAKVSGAPDAAAAVSGGNGAAGSEAESAATGGAGEGVPDGAPSVDATASAVPHHPAGGREARGRRSSRHAATVWESGYEFLDEIFPDKTGGGFDWHAFREEQRERRRGGTEEAPPLPEEPAVPFADRAIKIAIVGKPNVGKSTLTNRMLGEERVIVADQPGTTRDSIYIPLERAGRKYIVIDTAGVRKRRKVSEMVEKFSIVKTLRAIEDCNVALLLIDARAHVSDQDLSLLGFILDCGRSLVIAVNKWDGLDPAVKDEIREELNTRLGFVDFARVHFISALYGTGVGNLFESVNEAYESATRRHSAAELNRILNAAVSEHEPPLASGRRIKLKYAHPGGYNPPRVVIHGNKVLKVPAAYKRYIINCFRKSLGIMGTPLFIEFREGSNPYADEKPAQRRPTQSKLRAERKKAGMERRRAHLQQKRLARELALKHHERRPRDS